MDNQKDYYGYRLANVNEKNSVSAIEDICNEDGVLLLSKGSPLTLARAELIAKHKLVRPLEQSVDIEKSFNGQELYENLIKFASSLVALEAVINHQKSHDLLLADCLYYEKFPLVRQKLTVLSSQLPEIYSNSLYSAIAGTALAIELNLDKTQRQVVFIGALMHNVGFLHLDPALTQDETSLERDDSIKVQSHPVIAKYFLDQVSGLPKTVGQSVADHHETNDGTGYPKHKFGMELSIESQILAFTDAIVIAHKQCKKYGEHAHQMIHVMLQLNIAVHFDQIYKTAFSLIKMGPAATNPPLNLPSISDLLIQQEYISQTLDATKKLAFVLMTNTRSRMIKSIASMLGRIATSIVSSGISQTEYHQWLTEQSKHTETQEALDILKSKVMQDEIVMQLERFKSIIWQAINELSDDDPTLKQNAIVSYDAISKIKSDYDRQ